jgi:FAD/FMN-containing dehydrogenase
VAVPVQGCVALSLERMNAMEAVDARTGLVTVQAGVTLQAVQEAAVAAGMVSAWTWAHAAAARSAAMSPPMPAATACCSTA